MIRQNFEFIGGFVEQWIRFPASNQKKKNICLPETDPSKKSLISLWMRKNLIWEKIVIYCCPLTLREKIRKSAVLQLTAAEIDTFSDASPQSPWYTYFKLPNKHIARIIKLHTVTPRDTQPQACQCTFLNRVQKYLRCTNLFSENLRLHSFLMILP